MSPELQFAAQLHRFVLQQLSVEVHGEVNGRFVSVCVKWRAQHKPEMLVLPFCPLGQWQDSFCQGILWGLCAELMQNVFHLPFPVTDAVL